MKAKDIEPGVVYGWRRGTLDTPSPVVFLAPVDAEHVYRTSDRHRPEGSPTYQKSTTRARPGRGIGYPGVTYGYPVATARLDASPDVLAHLTKVTLADFEASASGSFDRESGIGLTLVTALGQIIGPYEEVRGAHEAERRRRWLEQEALDAERIAEAEHADYLKARLNALGLQGTSVDLSGSPAIALGHADMDELLARLDRP